MTAKKPIIGCTETSSFQNDILIAIDKFYGANHIKLSQNDPEDLAYWLNQCDAVILAGGVDIHPRIYGKEIRNECNFSYFDIARDIREVRIIKHCFQHNIPILGICRGHQMLGIFHGLDLIQDISDSETCHNPKNQKISHAQEEPMHWVRLLANIPKEYEIQATFESEMSLRKPKDKRYIYVNSFHHQALLMNAALKEDQHPSIKAIGWATGPGSGKEKCAILEWMSGKNNSWMSVQWHPEYDWQKNDASRFILTKFKEMVPCFSKTEVKPDASVT